MESNKKPNNNISTAAGGDILIQSPPNCISANVEHPLLNALIVDKILEQLNPSFEELKTFRLVSKVWTEVSLHHWRNSRAVLTLIPEHPSFFTPPKHNNGLPVNQFFTEFQDPNSPFQLSEEPFSKYKFKGLTFDIREWYKTGGPAQSFWNSIGPLIKSLFFENCIFLKPKPDRWRGQEEVTCPIMAQLLIGFMPNVKHLVLNDVVIKEFRSSVQIEQVFAEKPHFNLRTLTFYCDMEPDINLKDLLKMTPNLESIQGMDSPKRIDIKVDAFLKTIQEVYQSDPKSDGEPGPLSKLKHLDLVNCRNFQNYSYVSGNFRQVPLESLAIYFEYACGSLKIALKSFSGTLKTLKLFRLPWKNKSICITDTSFFHVRLPIFPASCGTWGNCLPGFLSEMSLLKELILWGTVVLDFGFLKNTPNLNRLIVDLECVGRRDLLRHFRSDPDIQKNKEDWAVKVPTDLRDGILCVELAHLQIDFEFPEESLRLLGKWIPNLKRLGMILNVTTVPVVCEVWRDLTELVCLHGSNIENSCFIRDQASSPAKLKFCDLKELERFQLDVCCGESKLTDDVVFNGFLKMPRLISVQICVDSQMTAEAEEALRKAIPFCKVIRNIAVTMVGSGNGGASGSGNCGCARCDMFRREARDSE